MVSTSNCRVMCACLSSAFANGLNNLSSSLEGVCVFVCGVLAVDWRPIQGGVAIVLVTLCYWSCGT